MARLGRKYKLFELEKEATTVLNKAFPRTLEEFDNRSMSSILADFNHNCLQALRLVVDMGYSDMTASAWFEACRHLNFEQALAQDLPPEFLVKLVLGHRDVSACASIALTCLVVRPECESPECQVNRQKVYHGHIAGALMSHREPGASYMERDMLDSVDLCGKCRAECPAQYSAARHQIWKALPCAGEGDNSGSELQPTSGIAQ